ncbi:MAG: endonuclease III [Planctomycetota bacterium]|nr:MAG: endonuclease III [Planctomycetota bacterium]
MPVSLPRGQTGGKRPPAVGGGLPPAPAPPADLASRKQQAARTVRSLAKEYPDAVCALVHRNPFELLIATILSAQCTDERVNIVTKDLFKKYPDADAFAAAPQAAIERAIKSTGFFRSKAKSIKACFAAIVDQHGGEVPQDLESLVRLPGVGRKTANVVLGVAYGKAFGVVVDTHVGRLSRRLGLTAATDATKVEADLMQVLPKKQWIDFSHRMIYHGRRVCIARRPRCEACVMLAFCPRVGVEY